MAKRLKPRQAAETALLDQLKTRILQGDNAAAFVERENALLESAATALTLPIEDRYAFQLRFVLERLSTPLTADEVFAGRAVEAVWERPQAVSHVPGGLGSVGHVTLDWATLLRRGLGAIAAEAETNAARLGTLAAVQFAANARNCADATAAFVRRYAQTARGLAEQTRNPAAQQRLRRIAGALEQVPMGPAKDFFSALQAIWIIHFLSSCVIGARDFAFGPLDHYLLPYLQADRARGVLDREAATELLAHFLLKSNEITGTATWNYKSKPVPSQASKQYLMLGGKGFNPLSEMIVAAAERIVMPQPTLTFQLSQASPPAAWLLAGRAAVNLGSQPHFYNHDLIMAALRRRGLADADAANYAMTGCCRLEIAHQTSPRMDRNYGYCSAPFWLYRALHQGRVPPGEEAKPHQHPFADAAIAGMDDILRLLHEAARQDIAAWRQTFKANDAQQAPFHFESLLVDRCLDTCRDCYLDGADIAMEGIFIGSIATVGDSLRAIEQLVFRERRFRLDEFLAVVDADFEGQENLRAEIQNHLPGFGNGSPEADHWTVQAAETILDAIDALPPAPGTSLVVPGFYSLDTHHGFGGRLPATPDGRHSGQPLSENQSPVYGKDRDGLTALLRSIASLPLERAPMGGLNVRIVGKAEPERISDILRTFFQMGGLHLGLSFLDHQELKEAQRHPGQHRSLQVRMYGFSEYFVSLSPTEQQEIINRTGH